MSKTRADLATLLADGLSLAEVARRTGLAYTTVSYHRDRIEHCDDKDSANVAVGATNPEEPQAAAYLHPVTTREEVHRLLRTGRSRAAVARHLGISKGTVTYHARRLGMEIDERGARRYDWSVVQRFYRCRPQRPRLRSEVWLQQRLVVQRGEARRPRRPPAGNAAREAA